MTEIPNRMKARPLFRGLPIPFTTLINAEGVPDFRITDTEKWMKAIEYKLCALCGQRLLVVIYFIGGPLCETNHLFFDPAMHEECARYAMAVCPFLALSSKAFSTRDFKNIDPSITIHYVESSAPETKRPERMGLFKTTSFNVVKHGNDVLILAGKWIDVEWFEGKESQA